MVFVALFVGFWVGMSGIGVGVMCGYADFVNEVSGCGGTRLRDAKGRSTGKSDVLIVGDGKEWWWFVIAVLFVIAGVAHQGRWGVVGFVNVWRRADS
jgi:hypothetical protein